MTPHQILIVAIRLLSVIWFLGLLAQVPVALITVREAGTLPSWYWGSLLFQFFGCALLWLFPATIALKLLRSGHEPVAVQETPFAHWRDLLFTALGMFVLVRSIPHAIYWSILASASQASAFSFDQRAQIFVTAVELVIGTALLLGAGRISRFAMTLRHAGRQTSV